MLEKSPSADGGFSLQDKTVKIGPNMMMEVKEGDITKEDTDAIVNSTNSKLSFAAGQLLGISGK